jgi:hypothetical protein
MENINIGLDELLKGCSLLKDSEGNIIVQTIMNMQLAFLTTEKENSLDDRFENPLTAVYASNRSYGEISLSNNGNKEVIVPPQVTIQTKQRAQNHGMVKGVYLDKKSSFRYEDAGCVQGSQTGHFTNTQEYRLMPLSIREQLFELMNGGGDYSRIYPTITKLGNQTASNTGNYLDKYYSKYDKKLEQFIAHFEKPNNLIGIVVLIDDEIVAIDKFPSFTYGEQIWEMLVRDAYASMAIIAELKNSKSKERFKESYGKQTGESVLEKIYNALNETKKSISDNVKDSLNDLLDTDFTAKMDTYSNTSAKVKSYQLTSEGYVGQYLSEGGFNHMVSIVKRESFDPSANKIYNELKKKARNQNRFTI